MPCNPVERLYLSLPVSASPLTRTLSGLPIKRYHGSEVPSLPVTFYKPSSVMPKDRRSGSCKQHRASSVQCVPKRDLRGFKSNHRRRCAFDPVGLRNRRLRNGRRRKQWRRIHGSVFCHHRQFAGCHWSVLYRAANQNELDWCWYRSARLPHDLSGSVKVDLSVSLGHVGRSVSEDRARSIQSVDLTQFCGGIVPQLVG